MKQVEFNYSINGKILYDYKQVAAKIGLTFGSVHQYGWRYRLGKKYKINGMGREIKLYDQNDINFMISRKGQVGNCSRRRRQNIFI